MATTTRLRKLPPSGLKSKKKGAFDPQVFLESVGASRRVSEFHDKEIIFSQGDAATSVLYIQKGSVKFTVVNEGGLALLLIRRRTLQSSSVSKNQIAALPLNQPLVLESRQTIVSPSHQAL